MPAVPCHLVFPDLFRRDKRHPIVLPLIEAAAHRIHIGVSKILEGLGGKRGTNTAGTVDDNRLTLVRQNLVSLHFQKPTGEENGFVEVALLPLVILADVEESKAIVRIEFILNVVNGYFSNMALCLP